MDSFKKQSESSPMKTMLSYAATFALGVLVFTAVVSNETAPVATVQQDTQQLWLQQPKYEFDWNRTGSRSWSQASLFDNIAVSTRGHLYGIQKYTGQYGVEHLAYTLNFTTGQWELFDKELNIIDIKFDRLGNYYIQDDKNQIYAANSKTKIVLKNVIDFEVDPSGRFHVISGNDGLTYNQWTTTNEGYTYKFYNQSAFSQIALNVEQPVLADRQNKAITLGNQCVLELSTGTDGSIFALDCVKDEDGNYQIIKWNKRTQRWFIVEGARGVELGVFNEISVATLDSKGRIFYSIEVNTNENVTYLTPGQAPNVSFSSSVILGTNVEFNTFATQIISQPQFGYKSATLCWRGSTHGFASQTFHQQCDKKGPTMTIIKATTGRVFGAIVTLSWESIANYKVDEKAQLFSMDRKETYAARTQAQGYPYHMYDNSGYGPTFGGGHDIHVATNANSNTNSYTNFGHTYIAPSGVTANTLFAGNYNFQVADIEVFVLQ